MSKSYTWEEISQHNTEASCWVVLYDQVVDVTKFLHIHPGGLDPINDMGGRDITKMFETIGHSANALSTSQKYIIGTLDKTSSPPVIKRKEPTPGSQKPLSKFSVEEDPLVRKLKLGLIVIVMIFVSLYIFS
jgi:cytochrome b involved in lipid metabolism